MENWSEAKSSFGFLISSLSAIRSEFFLFSFQICVNLRKSAAKSSFDFVISFPSIVHFFPVLSSLQGCVLCVLRALCGIFALNPGTQTIFSSFIAKVSSGKAFPTFNRPTILKTPAVNSFNPTKAREPFFSSTTISVSSIIWAIP